MALCELPSLHSPLLNLTKNCVNTLRIRKLHFLFLLSLLFVYEISTGQTDNCSINSISVQSSCLTSNYTITKSNKLSPELLSCGIGQRDGWFSFTTGVSTTHINIEGTSDQELGLVVYSGSCISLTEVFCTVPYSANASITNLTVSPNTTYFLRIVKTNSANKVMNGTICVYNSTPTCKVWNGSAGNNWFNASNWTPNGVPSSTDCVEIPNTVNLPELIGLPPVPPNAVAKNLTIHDDTTLVINSGLTLVVSEEVTIGSDALIDIKDGGSLIQTNAVSSNNNSGNIRMERRVSGINSLDYVFWAAPVEDFGVTSISPGTPASLVWKWIPTVSGNGKGNHGEWQNTAEVMIPGKGYIVRGLSGTGNAEHAYFLGVPNNGTMHIPISRGNYNGQPYIGNSTTTQAQDTDDNWNLVGNPFPSAISADLFLEENVLNNEFIDGSIYLWTHQSSPSNATSSPFYNDYTYNYNPSDFIEYNAMGSNPPGFSGSIASGQSFFVLMDGKASSPSNLEFNNSMREVTLNNDNFYSARPQTTLTTFNNTETYTKSRIWLDLITSNNLANSILIGYLDKATNKVDRLYDTKELEGSDISFYSVLGSKQLSIQGRGLPFSNSDKVPLGLLLPESDSYTIALNTIDGLFNEEEQGIYLEDKARNIIHDLKSSPYNFTSDNGRFNKRFELRFDKPEDNLINSENAKIRVYRIGDEIVVESRIEAISRLSFNDIYGRKLFDVNSIFSKKYSTKKVSTKLPLLVEITLSSGYTITRKIKMQL